MFTKEDAQDDSKIKSEVSSDIVRTAKQSNPRIFKHFENVCENMDQSPRMVLADMLVRALNNQEFAESVLETEVTMEAISRGEYRKEDIEMVKDIADTFDLTPDNDGGSDGLIDEIISQRIEAVSSGPFDEFTGSGRGRQSSNEQERIRQLNSQIDQLEREVQKLRSGASDAEVEQRPQQDGDENERKDIDELFDDGSNEETETSPNIDEDQGNGEDDEDADTFSVDVSSQGMEAGPELESGSEDQDEQPEDGGDGPDNEDSIEPEEDGGEG